MKPYRALPRAAAALAALTLLAGCASPAAETTAAKETKAAASSSKAAPATSASATPTKAPVAEEGILKGPRTISIKELKADGVKVGTETWKNKHGEFPVLEVQPNAPITRFTPALFKAKLPASTEGSWDMPRRLPSGWTNKDAKAAQAVAAKFVMDVVLNGPSIGDESSRWRSVMIANKVATPSMVDGLKNSSGRLGMVVPGDKGFGDFNLDGKKLKMYSIYDGMTPRLGTMGIRPSAAASTDEGAFALYFKGRVDWNASSKDLKKAYRIPVDLEGEVMMEKTGDGFLVETWSVHSQPVTDVQIYQAN